MQIGFIGTGRITRRLVGGAAGGAHSILVTRRNERISAELAAAHPAVEVVDSPQSIVDRSDVVFLCLHPQVARELLADLRFSAEQSVVSVMAEFGLAELRSMVAPAREVSITIPMPPIEHGGCPLPVHPHSAALESIYGARNPILPVDNEKDLEPFWAVAGTVATVLAELQTMAAWLGERIGDPDTGERYVTNLYSSSLASVGKDGAGHLAAALHDLSIEGGLNATVREAIARSGHYDELRVQLDLLYERVRG